MKPLGSMGTSHKWLHPQSSAALPLKNPGYRILKGNHGEIGKSLLRKACDHHFKFGGIFLQVRLLVAGFFCSKGPGIIFRRLAT